MLKQTINNFLEYLRSVKNSSPHTVINYGKDLEQFREYLSPPGLQAPGMTKITHHMIREFVGHLHEQGLQKSSIARKLAASSAAVTGPSRPMDCSRCLNDSGGSVEKLRIWDRVRRGPSRRTV